MDPGGNYVYIPDDYYLNPQMFHMPSRYEGFLETILVTNGGIGDRTKKLAEDIIRDHNSDQIIFLCVLRGAFMFFKELVDKAHKISHGQYSHLVEFIRAKSYNRDVQGDITIEGLEGLNLEGQNVVIIEDLVDSGRTLAAVTAKIRLCNPKKLSVCVLSFKRNPKNTFIVPEYIGYSIPDKWIVGYNIDYNGHFRDLTHLSALNDAGKEHFK